MPRMTLVTALTVLLMPAAPAAEGPIGASPWASTEQTQVRLVAATRAVGDASAVRLGLQFRLEPGWKIYWRSPGDAGIPPELDWRGSSNLRSVEMAWPVPERSRAYGLTTIGYADEVVLPLLAKLEQSGRRLIVTARLTYGVCREICIPYDADLALELPEGSADPSVFAPLIERYAARVPVADPAGGFSFAAALHPADEGQALEIVARSAAPFAAPDLLVEAAGWSAALPEVQLDHAGHRARFRFALAPATADRLRGAALVLTLIDGARAVEYRLPAGWR